MSLFFSASHFQLTHYFHVTVLLLFISSRKAVPSTPIDISRNAQLRDIDASFAASNDNFDLSTLKHPNKPDITAVGSYPILPDAEVWPNQYDLFRFSERPGDRDRKSVV